MKNKILTINFLLILLLVVGIIISVILAIIPLKTQITFGFDQARDAYEAYAIWHNFDIKIQGPSSDIPGVYHGVLWYYALAFPYAISNGNPELVAFTFFILAFLTLPLCGLISYRLFKDYKIAIISTILYSFSPLFQVFTRWLSNPLLAIFVTPFILLFLWQYIQKQNKLSAFFIGLCMGLLIQANFAYGMFLFVLPLYWYYFKLKARKIDFVLFFVGLSLSVSTFIVAEIHFSGKTITALLKFLNGNFAFSPDATSNLLGLIDKFIELIYISVLPLPKLGILFLICFIFYCIKNKREEKEKSIIIFLFIWLSNILFFMFFRSGIMQSGYLFGPSLFPITMLAGYFLVTKIKKNSRFIAAIVIIFILQSLKSYSWMQNQYTPLSVQRNINYFDARQVIDYTYKSSSNKPFTITSITTPLYINTTWAYLYETHGKNTYGFVPYWHGRSQKGYLGNLPEKPFATNERYLIMEPLEGLPKIYITKLIYEEDRLSDVLEEKKFGGFIVQKRLFHPEKHIATPSSLLKDLEILYE